MNWGELAGYLISAVAVVAAALITRRSTRRSAGAAAELRRSFDSLTESYESAQRANRAMQTQWTKEIDRLNVEISDLRSSNRSLEGYVRQLITVIDDAGLPIPVRGR